MRLQKPVSVAEVEGTRAREIGHVHDGRLRRNPVTGWKDKPGRDPKKRGRVLTPEEFIQDLTGASKKRAKRIYREALKRAPREREHRSAPWSRRERGVADAVAWHLRGSRWVVFWFGRGSRLKIGTPGGSLTTVDHPGGAGHYDTWREAEAAVRRVFG